MDGWRATAVLTLFTRDSWKKKNMFCNKVAKLYQNLQLDGVAWFLLSNYLSGNNFWGIETTQVPGKIKPKGSTADLVFLMDGILILKSKRFTGYVNLYTILSFIANQKIHFFFNSRFNCTWQKSFLIILNVTKILINWPNVLRLKKIQNGIWH